VIARAALYASQHPSREIWVAGSAVKAILGQKLIPGLLDRYLGRIGYDAQQTKEPIEPYRRDNVFAPIPGDRGAHGRFDDESRGSSLELWTRVRRAFVAGGVAAAALALSVKALRG
ncbi:MAG: short-chain dehydrogenase, partial [Myxococcales bacterium]